MADKLKVRAVEGRLLQYEGNKPGYVGYRTATADDDVHHVIPDAVNLTRTDDVIEVPNTTYYRNAIRVGDVDEVNEEQLRNALTSAPNGGN